MIQQTRIPLLPVRNVVSAAVFTSRVLAVVISGHVAHLAAGPVSAVRRRGAGRRTMSQGAGAVISPGSRLRSSHPEEEAAMCGRFVLDYDRGIVTSSHSHSLDQLVGRYGCREYFAQ